jgi:anti-sigma factor RsiW
MCDVQAKLVAWLDRELPVEEAGEVERHVERCNECRDWVAKCAQVSSTVDAYCDAVMAAKTSRRIPHWVPMVAGAVVAAGVLILATWRTRVEPRAVPLLDSETTTTSVAAPESVDASPVVQPGPRNTAVHKRHAVRRDPEYLTNRQPMDTAIEIAIPAEAMFPPGAMPNGMNFVADLRIAPDGSVKQVRLRQ